jgi:hypothetical protein
MFLIEPAGGGERVNSSEWRRSCWELVLYGSRADMDEESCGRWGDLDGGSISGFELQVQFISFALDWLKYKWQYLGNVQGIEVLLDVGQAIAREV